jgi:hypothetical protein
MRDAAEQLRAQAERARALDEQYRDEWETTRQDREAIREAAEEVRQAAEDARQHTLADLAATAESLSTCLAQMQFLQDARNTLRQLKKSSQVRDRQ